MSLHDDAVTLMDFECRDWKSLSGDEKWVVVGMIWGWHYTDGEWLTPQGEFYSNSNGYNTLPNCTTDPGSAMELFKAKAKEYDLTLNPDSDEGFYCTFSDPTSDCYNANTHERAAELVICEAVYCAWQSRIGVTP